MRAYAWFIQAFIRLCLVLVCLGTGCFSVSAQDPTQLPPNTFLLQPGNLTLVDRLDKVEEDRLMAHVEALQNMQTRHVDSATAIPGQGIEAAAAYILSEFEAIHATIGNLSVVTQEFYAPWNNKALLLKNIIAVIPGTEIQAGTLVIGAHYDSRCSNLYSGTCNAPGANDNASGVAALIELARILSTRPHRISITLVAFSGEEIGRLGSIAFVEDYIKTQQIPVIAMINLDMIGGSMGNTNKIRLFSAGPAESPSRSLARTIDLMAYHYLPDMEILFQDRADRPSRYGDHISFSDAGYPAVRFIEEIEDTNHQHNGLDTIDEIQPDYLRSSTRTVLGVVILLAEGSLLPSGITLSQNNNGTRVLSWTPMPGAVSYIVALRSSDSVVYDLRFEVSGTTIEWDRFDQFAGLVIAAKDANGLMGWLSEEQVIN